MGILFLSAFCNAVLCVHSSVAIILNGKDKAGCFPFIFLNMICYCKYSVALPNGALGWSAMCDCGNS